MNFELRKYNIEQVKKVLKDVKGKSVFVNDTQLNGVVSIEIEESTIYDGDPCSEEDGSKSEYIDLIFNFGNGCSATHSFCPDIQHCEIIFETDDLWIVRIEDLKEYIERAKDDLDFRLA